MTEQTFGKYQLLAGLGQGGMADVILAVAKGPAGLHKLSVLKRLRCHLADDPEFVTMLVDEARLAARLNHPNIVHTHEVGEVDGRFFIAMEYLEGQSLARLKRQARRGRTPLPLDLEIRVLADVLAGLHHAHEIVDYGGKPVGLVHRDICPSNVFVTYEGIVKLVDFGIAKAAGRTTETRIGMLKGTLAYMSPEQALSLEIDRRADLFSVGVMLWEALVGRRMWKGFDDVEILRRLMTGDVLRSPLELRPDVPLSLDRVCQNALAQHPTNRFQTALEFQNELETYLENCGRRPTHRKLGRVTSQLFEVERREINSIIARQLSKVEEKRSITLEPVIIPADTEPSPDCPDALLVASVGVRTEPSIRRSVLALAGGGVAALVGMVSSLQSGLVAPVEVKRAAIETPAPPSAAPDEDKPSKVRITLRAAPSAARFTIDGGTRLENPYVGEFDRDKARHRILVEAPGHESRVVIVTFDKNVLLDLTLEEQSPPPQGPPLRSRPREIFTGDPWK